MIHLIGSYYMTAGKNAYTVGEVEESRPSVFLSPVQDITLPLPVPWQKPQKSHCATKSQLARSQRCMMLWIRSAA